MDALGARQPTVFLEDLTVWGSTEPDTPPPQAAAAGGPLNFYDVSPFPVREDLNKKVALW